jgi:hypothetical protein
METAKIDERYIISVVTEKTDPPEFYTDIIQFIREATWDSVNNILRAVKQHYQSTNLQDLISCI